ncbi:MAG: GH3 auxin-responsive promoter family protein [Candidatus Falkowbacteria bacterium]|nr:GH3 auxin-responsive promoter family protein [Candidatus Falkowbacteria bacterium]
MPFINSLVSLALKSRLEEISRFKKDHASSSQRVFFDLLREAAGTDWGKKYGYANIVVEPNFNKAYQLFKGQVPLSSYDDLHPWIEKIISGNKSVLWPGETKWFAKSSGTTGDKSKFIPVTSDSLEGSHYQAGKDLLALYLDCYPKSNICVGKTLSIGGTYRPDSAKNNILCGDLSAILMDNLPFWARFMRVPEISIALLDEWEEKIEKISHETIKENVVALAGVPSWTLIILRRILEITGKKNILEVWPDLELFIHGGVSFTPYREQFKELIPSDKMHYLEVYNASEGFFAMTDDFSRDDLLLFLDYGIFYEFIPLEELGEESPQAFCLEEVELGKNYALAISTNGGLWRYLIGDTVEITSINPTRIKISGRTKHFINVFGEELMIANADKAIEIASLKNSVSVREYTAAPIYFGDNKQGGHEWLIEFTNPPEDLAVFAKDLDDALKSLNSDYEAKRYQDLILGFPKVQAVRKDLFYDWLKKKGKLGGQNKVPRLFNRRDYLDELLSFE